ncbi:MAG: SAM-dependent methyltransferase, partial [Acidimicrobiia bacterium]
MIEAIDGHPRAGDVRGRLVELDPRNCDVARAAAPAGVEVDAADASDTNAYRGAVPAELVLACGVFGNISDSHIQR